MYRFMQICGHITCTLTELEMTPMSEKGTTRILLSTGGTPSLETEGINKIRKAGICISV